MDVSFVAILDDGTEDDDGCPGAEEGVPDGGPRYVSDFKAYEVEPAAGPEALGAGGNTSAPLAARLVPTPS